MSTATIRPLALFAPNGKPVIGTLDLIHATAYIMECPAPSPDGTYELNFAEGSKVHWDTQTTITDSRGQRIFTTDHADEWPEDSLVFADMNNPPAPWEWSPGAPTGMDASDDSPWSRLLDIAAERHTTATRLATGEYDDESHESALMENERFAADALASLRRLADPYEELHRLRSFIASISRMKKEGEYYDGDGNRIDDEVEAARLGIDPWEPDGNDEEIDALYSLVSKARELTTV